MFATGTLSKNLNSREFKWRRICCDRNRTIQFAETR